MFYDLRKMVSLLLQGNPNVVSMLWLLPEHYLVRTACGDELIANRHLFQGKHIYNSFAGYAYQQLLKMESRDPADLREYLALTTEAKYRGIHPNEKGKQIPYPPDHDVAHGEGKNAVAHSNEVLLAKLARYIKKGENLGYLGDKRKRLVLEHGYDSKNASHCVRLLRMGQEYLVTGVMNVHRQDASELLDIKLGKWPLKEVKQHAEDLFAAMKDTKAASSLPEEPDHAGAEALLVKLLSQELELKTA